MVCSLVRSRLWGLRLSGTDRSLTAPPFQCSTRSARPSVCSRCTVMLISPRRLRSSCFLSLSVVVVGERGRAGGLAAGELGFGTGQLREGGVQLGFQAAGHQPVLRVDRAVTAFGPGCCVAGLLGLAAVLGDDRIMAGFQLL